KTIRITIPSTSSQEDSMLSPIRSDGNALSKSLSSLRQPYEDLDIYCQITTPIQSTILEGLVTTALRTMQLEGVEFPREREPHYELPPTLTQFTLRNCFNVSWVHWTGLPGVR